MSSQGSEIEIDAMIFESAPSSSSSSPEVLIQEETLMKYFSGLIQASFGAAQSAKRTNGAMKVHWRVSTTAIVFFRRFYLKNDLLQHDPRIIMLAAVFLAGKIEEFRIGIRDLLLVYDKCTSEAIQACELLLLQVTVRHPQSYVHTLIADFKRLTGDFNRNTDTSSSSSSSDRIDEVDLINGSSEMKGEDPDKDKASTSRREWSLAAEGVLDILQLSNASLRYSPLVIAICSLKHTEPMGIFPSTFDTYLTKRFGDTAISLLQQAEEVKSQIGIAKEPIDMKFLKSTCMERLKKESVWSTAKVKKPKSIKSIPIDLTTNPNSDIIEEKQVEIPMDIS